MELFAPYVTLPVIAVCTWLGMRQGAQLRERGFTLRQRLTPGDLPGIAMLVPFVVVATPPFLLLRQHQEYYWYLPLRVQLYEGGFVWTLVLCSFFLVAGIALAVGSARAMRHKRWVLVAVLGLAGVAEYAIRQSPFLQPPELLEARMRDGVVLQTSGSTCAAASVANIAGQFGAPRTEREMVALMGTTAFGTTVAQVYGGLRKLAFVGKGGMSRAATIVSYTPPQSFLWTMGTTRLGTRYVTSGKRLGRPKSGIPWAEKVSCPANNSPSNGAATRWRLTQRTKCSPLSNAPGTPCYSIPRAGFHWARPAFT